VIAARRDPLHTDPGALDGEQDDAVSARLKGF